MELFMVNFNYDQFWRSSTGLNRVELLRCHEKGAVVFVNVLVSDTNCSCLIK